MIGVSSGLNPPCTPHVRNPTLLQMHDGRLMLETRVANLRSVPINDAEVTIMLASSYRVRSIPHLLPASKRESCTELLLHIFAQTAEGRVGYRGVELAPLRKKMQSLHTMWNIYHVIDETSPLFGTDPAELTRDFTQVSVTIAGVDCAQEKPVRVSQAYGMGDIVFGGAYRDVLSFHKRERMTCSERFFSTHPCGSHQWVPPCCAGPGVEFHNVYSRLSTHLLDTVDGGERGWTHRILPEHGRGVHSSMPKADEGGTVSATAAASPSASLNGSHLQKPLLAP